MTCSACHGSGVVAERYCTCTAAAKLRDRIDAMPAIRRLALLVHEQIGERAEAVWVRLDSGQMLLHPVTDQLN